jgi:membrane protein Man1
LIFRKRLKTLWERAKKQISESESRVRSESQLIHGEEFDVWRWIQPRSPSSPSSPRKKRAVRYKNFYFGFEINIFFQESPHNINEESYVYMPSDVGLTECLKLRNFFGPDKYE